ncbi:MAG: peptidylprolyl isomerase [Chloroherpetonaceae bacterium]|nr:peptidylprolyl isomerase [Chloroherpetonaceae bacterium]MDW8437581.1 peptidylprolyl isomerase [Chloroherpetonaceae bacterium]
MNPIALCLVLSLSLLRFGCEARPAQKSGAIDSLAAKPRVVIESSLGNITIELFDDAPLHRDNFIRLVKAGYYDGLCFHRVVPGFVIQTGDAQFREKPNPALDSLPPKTIPAEIKHSHRRGTVAAARLDDDVNPKRESSGCQFFINLNDNRSYDGRYTVFGKVVEGMDVVDKFEKLPRDGMNVPYSHIALKFRLAQ